MYKKLGIVLLGLLIILIAGTGLGSDGSPGMFIKICVGLMAAATSVVLLMIIFKRQKR